MTNGSAILANDRGYSRLGWIKANGNCWIPLDFNFNTAAVDFSASFDSTTSAGCVFGSAGGIDGGLNALVVHAVEGTVSYVPFTHTTKDGVSDLYDKEGNIEVIEVVNGDFVTARYKHYTADLFWGFGFTWMGEKYCPGVTYSKDENNEFTSIAFTFPEIRATGEVGDPTEDDCYQFHFPVKPSYSMKDYMGSFWVREERFQGVTAWRMVNESRQFILWVNKTNGRIYLADVSGMSDEEVLNLDEIHITTAEHGYAGCVNKGRIIQPTYRDGRVVTGWTDQWFEYQQGSTVLEGIYSYYSHAIPENPYKIFDGVSRHFRIGEGTKSQDDYYAEYSRTFTHDTVDENAHNIRFSVSCTDEDETWDDPFWNVVPDTNFPSYIFAKNIGNAPAEMITGMTLRRLRIGTGDPSHDLVPVMSSGGQVGLFDTITNKFYPIQGSGYTYG